MQDDNPYASPRSSDALTPNSASVQPLPNAFSVWRFGRYLIVPNETALPDMCAICTDRTNQALRQAKFGVSNPWISVPSAAAFFLLMVVSKLDATYRWTGIGAVIVLSWWLNRRYGRFGAVYYRLCSLHERAKWRFRIIGWLGGLCAIAGVAGAGLIQARSGSGELEIGTMVGIAATLIGLVVVVFAAANSDRPFELHKIQAGHLWLSGFDTRFMNLIPEATEEQVAQMSADS
jgi:hypothetical protein